MFEQLDPMCAGTDTDFPAASTRLRVERQVHLPASREEAWGALRHLIPDDQWDDAFPVFGALESIFRCAEGNLAGYQIVVLLLEPELVKSSAVKINAASML